MNMTEFASNYRTFLDSRRYVTDPNEEEVMKAQGFDDMPSWCYMNALIIYAPKANQFVLTIGNQSVTSDRLDVLEPILFDYAMHEGYFDSKPDSPPSAVRELGAAEKLVDYLNKKYGNYGMVFFIQDNFELMVYLDEDQTPSFVDEISSHIAPIDLKMCVDYNSMVNKLLDLNIIKIDV